jgi:hypothetical protein
VQKKRELANILAEVKMRSARVQRVEADLRKFAAEKKNLKAGDEFAA